MDVQNLLYKLDGKLNHKEFEKTKKIKILNSKQKYQNKSRPQKLIKKNYVINKKEKLLEPLKIEGKKKINILAEQNPIKCGNKINLSLILSINELTYLK